MSDKVGTCLITSHIFDFTKTIYLLIYKGFEAEKMLRGEAVFYRKMVQQMTVWGIFGVM